MPPMVSGVWPKCDAGPRERLHRLGETFHRRLEPPMPVVDETSVEVEMAELPRLPKFLLGRSYSAPKGAFGSPNSDIKCPKV